MNSFSITGKKWIFKKFNRTETISLAEKYSLFEDGRLYDLLVFYEKDGEIMTSFYHYETWPGIFEKEYKTYPWAEYSYQDFMWRYNMDSVIQGIF